MLYRDPAQIADGWLMRAAPALWLTLLVLIAALPTPFDQSPVPDLVLTGVYAACIRRPESVPIAVLFALGLLQDLLSTVPFGLHAVVYVLVHGLATRLPVARDSFLQIWLGFVPVAALAGAAGWLAVCLHHMVWIAPDPVLARSAASVIAFPVLALPLLWLFGYTRHVP